MAIKLVAIDIDGTLITDQLTITPATKAAIQAATKQGVKVVLCTGRPMTGVSSYLDQLELSGLQDEYVISFNGGLAQNTAGDPLAEFVIPFDDMIDLGSFALKQGLHMVVETSHHIHSINRQISPFSTNESNLVSLPLQYSSLDALADCRQDLTISKLMFTDDAHLIDQAINDLPEELDNRFNIVRSEPYYLEFVNPKASKGSALKLLGEELGIQADKMMALGNAQNDESMLEFAGLGVAMENSIPSTLAIADAVTASNNDDGVAKAIEKYVLQ